MSVLFPRPAWSFYRPAPPSFWPAEEGLFVIHSMPCPAWCDRRHLSDTSAADPIHERGGPILPGVTRVVRGTPGGEPAVTAESCEVRPVLFSCASGPDETWLAVELGDHGPGLSLTAESWRRVLPEVTALFGLLEPG